MICSWRLILGGESSEEVTDEDEGRMDITSGRSLRFVRWRQVGLLQGIVATMIYDNNDRAETDINVQTAA